MLKIMLVLKQTVELGMLPVTTSAVQVVWDHGAHHQGDGSRQQRVLGVATHRMLQ